MLDLKFLESKGVFFLPNRCRTAKKTDEYAEISPSL